LAAGDLVTAVTRRLGRARLAAALFVAAWFGAEPVPAAPLAGDPGFPVRMVKLGGPADDPASIQHVRFCRKLGFNALFVYGHEAGAWTEVQAPRGPLLDPGFLRLARWCRRHHMDLWVSINPVDESHGAFVFSDPEGERRLAAFVKLLEEKAGVRRIVLSFDDQPTALENLSDIFRYGASSAPAHLDLTKRLAAALPADVGLWLCAAAYCDANLGDGSGPYSKPFLQGLPSLPPEIGIVWTGPTVVSPAITRADLEATRARLGGRNLLLYDNFPVNENGSGDAIALILGALRGREAGIRDVVAAYLACPEFPLAASRLSLLTIAEFLADPGRYEPDAAAARAVARLAGRNAQAKKALETQQIEWGGFVDSLNYWPREEANPERFAHRLKDPAFVESFTWTVARYPGRIAALKAAADAPFRDDLIRIMNRRLAIARVMPLTVEYFARLRAGTPGADALLARIADERRSWSGDPDASRILDLFLHAAAVPVAPGAP
jgi:hypothetical protein